MTKQIGPQPCLNSGIGTKRLQVEATFQVPAID